MGKFHKLIENPGNYFRDALRNVGLTSRSPLFQPIDIPSNQKATLSRSWVIDCLVRKGAAFTVRADGYPFDINCPISDLPALMKHAKALASQMGCQLYTHIQGTARRPNFRMGPFRGIGNAPQLHLMFQRGHLGCEINVAIWEFQHHAGEDHLVIRANCPHIKRIRCAVLEAAFNRQTRTLDLAGLLKAPVSGSTSLPIDVVYTWVNHADPKWRASLETHVGLAAVDWDRYTCTDELRYSMRSVRRYAPWARRIILVTNCDPPTWLKRDHPQIEIIDHTQIFPDADQCLPTFNSHAIEACLHRIPDLSEHFVYFNDDTFLNQDTPKSAFFTPTGCSVAYLEPHGLIRDDAVVNDAESYLVAAANGQALMREMFDVSPTQLHKHAPFALRVSVLKEMENHWAEAFKQVRAARFRSPTDLSIPSFLYHHYAIQNRCAVLGHLGCVLVRGHNWRRKIADINSKKAPAYFCINDGGGSTSDPKFQSAKRRFLDQRFPLAAPWEKLD